ncbi:MAG: hypothetical protein IKQ13_04785 [Treponema sp.]|nr:hypothetical protein [Treponema sp.]
MGAINIPSVVTEINDGIFTECISIKYLTFPSGLKKLGHMPLMLASLFLQGGGFFS